VNARRAQARPITVDYAPGHGADVEQHDGTRLRCARSMRITDAHERLRRCVPAEKRRPAARFVTGLLYVESESEGPSTNHLDTVDTALNRIDEKKRCASSAERQDQREPAVNQVKPLINIRPFLRHARDLRPLRNLT